MGLSTEKLCILSPQDEGDSAEAHQDKENRHEDAKQCCHCSENGATMQYIHIRPFIKFFYVLLYFSY